MHPLQGRAAGRAPARKESERCTQSLENSASADPAPTGSSCWPSAPYWPSSGSGAQGAQPRPSPSSCPSSGPQWSWGLCSGFWGSSFSSWARNSIPMSQVQRKLNPGYSRARTASIAHGAVTGRSTIPSEKCSGVSEQGRSIFIRRTACSTFPISSSMTPPGESSSGSGENAGSRLNL